MPAGQQSASARTGSPSTGARPAARLAAAWRRAARRRAIPDRPALRAAPQRLEAGAGLERVRPQGLRSTRTCQRKCTRRHGRAPAHAARARQPLDARTSTSATRAGATSTPCAARRGPRAAARANAVDHRRGSRSRPSSTTAELPGRRLHLRERRVPPASPDCAPALLAGLIETQVDSRSPPGVPAARRRSGSPWAGRS